MVPSAPKAWILVVDDEESVRGLLSQMLSTEGFACESCSSGPHAMETLAQHSFDAVLSDLQMPQMSGLELLKRCREKYPHLPFLMATGLEDLSVVVQAMRQGAVDYLVKPFQSDVVLSAVERAIERGHLELEVEQYRRRLEELAEQRAQQIRAAMKRIEQTYDETLEVLSAALDLRDVETAGHSRRVSCSCLEISQAMRCTPEELKNIAQGAYLHDVGKIGIPDSILLKGTRLTDQERKMMENHVKIGYELVRSIPFLAPAAEIVLTHHERYDGTGYPQGLQGEAIPIGSRIFAVADSLDAMTSDRPYRHALPFSAAREEILREAGRQFDPEVVRVFLAIPETRWEDIRKEVAARRSSGTRSSTAAAQSRGGP